MASIRKLSGEQAEVCRRKRRHKLDLSARQRRIARDRAMLDMADRSSLSPAELSVIFGLSERQIRRRIRLARALRTRERQAHAG